MSNQFTANPGPGPVPPSSALPPIALEQLSDVDISTPVSGQLLAYDSVGSEWFNTSVADLPFFDNGNVSGSLTINRQNGEYQALTLTGDTTISNFTHWPASGQAGRVTLFVTNTGSFNITGWPAAVKWAGGVAPTVTSGSGKLDIFVFVNNGVHLYGTIAGQNYS